MKKMKDNIHNYDIVPFNEYFYRSCFYNNVLTVLKNFKKNTLELLLNDKFIFVLKEQDNNSYLSVNYLSYLPLQQFLSKMGILFSCYDVKAISFEAFVIEQLISGRIMIVWVDNYFLPYKVNNYNKNHYLTTLLVYGYNVEKKEFLVIDTSDNQRLDYRQFLVKDTVLISAYSSIFDLHQSSSIIPFMTFYNIDSKCHSTNVDWRRQYTYGEIKEQSKQDILKLISDLCEISSGVRGKNEYQEKELWLKGLNEIVLAEEARCRVLSFILEENSMEIIIENNILNQWRKVRNICLKANYTNQWDANFFDKVIHCMEDIYKREIRDKI